MANVLRVSIRVTLPRGNLTECEDIVREVLDLDDDSSGLHLSSVPHGKKVDLLIEGTDAVEAATLMEVVFHLQQRGANFRRCEAYDIDNMNRVDLRPGLNYEPHVAAPPDTWVRCTGVGRVHVLFGVPKRAQYMLTDAALVPGKTIEATGMGAYAEEPISMLLFTDGTCHGFVQPFGLGPQDDQKTI
jgi:hypothetical protein